MMRVLIVDDHAVLRRGLKALLAEEFADAQFGEASNAEEARAQLVKQPWDLALLDVSLPGKNGLEVLKEFKTLRPKVRVLVLSVHPEDQFAVRALKAGAAGYLTKESAPEVLVKAVRKVLAGGRYVSPTLAEKFAMNIRRDDSGSLPHEALSDREYEIMCRIATGMTVTEIAALLSLSVKTISTYRTRILQKLAVRNSAEIVRYAVRNDLVQ